MVDQWLLSALAIAYVISFLNFLNGRSQASHKQAGSPPTCVLLSDPIFVSEPIPMTSMLEQKKTLRDFARLLAAFWRPSAMLSAIGYCCIVSKICLPLLLLLGVPAIARKLPTSVVSASRAGAAPAADLAPALALVLAGMHVRMQQTQQTQQTQ